MDINSRAAVWSQGRLNEDFLCCGYVRRFSWHSIFCKPAVENHDRFRAGHDILFIGQLETLRAVSKIHPYLSMREQLDNDGAFCKTR